MGLSGIYSSFAPADLQSSVDGNNVDVERIANWSESNGLKLTKLVTIIFCQSDSVINDAHPVFLNGSIV